MSQDTPTLKPVTFWQLRKNPILLRYMRSRMRWSGLLVAVILTIVITTFTFLLSYHLLADSEVEYMRYRAIFIPIFLIQIAIMMLLGTGTVAGGITQEYDDGMVEYQRLTPMTPMAKIVGYLFGLPIREWLMFSVTMIATAIIAVKGQLPLNSIIKVYSIFFLTVILYHLLALIVVHNMKRKRVASRVIQLLVIILYFVLPNLSAFGLIFFEYLTVRPVLAEETMKFIPQSAPILDFLGMNNLTDTVPFFNERIKSWNFSVMVQLSLVISFVVMLRRRWKDSTSHLMSKPFAVLFCGYFLFILLGNSIPLAQRGSMNISEKFMENREERLENYVDSLKDLKEQRKERKRINKLIIEMRKNSKQYAPLELAAIQTIFGTICVALACILIFIVTPKKEKYIVGMRRARNRNKKWVPIHWDEASGFLTTVLITGIMSYALYQFSTTLFSASNAPYKVKELKPFIPYVVIFAGLVILAFHLVYEAWEKKGLFMLLLFVWVLPLMVGLILNVSPAPRVQGIWVSSISPLMGYNFGLMAYDDIPVREAFYLSLFIQACITIIAGIKVAKDKFTARKLVRKEETQVIESSEESLTESPSTIA